MIRPDPRQAGPEATAPAGRLCGQPGHPNEPDRLHAPHPCCLVRPSIVFFQITVKLCISLSLILQSHRHFQERAGGAVDAGDRAADRARTGRARGVPAAEEGLRREVRGAQEDRRRAAGGRGWPPGIRLRGREGQKVSVSLGTFFLFLLLIMIPGE